MDCLDDGLAFSQERALAIKDFWQESQQGVELSTLHSMENQWRLASADDEPEKGAAVLGLRGRPYPQAPLGGGSG